MPTMRVTFKPNTSFLANGKLYVYGETYTVMFTEKEYEFFKRYFTTLSCARKDLASLNDDAVDKAVDEGNPSREGQIAAQKQSAQKPQNASAQKRGRPKKS